MPQNTSSTPVEWAQRKNYIYVNIRVEDLVDPVVKIEEEKLYIKGVGGADKKNHEVTLDLFGKVIPDESKYMVRGRGAEIVLVKADKDGPYWKRLLKDDKKHHWLKVDFNKWQDEEESDDEIGMGGAGGSSFEEMMRQMGGLGGGLSENLDDFGDEEDEAVGDTSDDDDEKLPDLVDADAAKPAEDGQKQ